MQWVDGLDLEHSKLFARNYEKKIVFGTSDTWSMRQLSHPLSDPAYYIEDCRILKIAAAKGAKRARLPPSGRQAGSGNTNKSQKHLTNP